MELISQEYEDDVAPQKRKRAKREDFDDENWAVNQQKSGREKGLEYEGSRKTKDNQLDF